MAVMGRSPLASHCLRASTILGHVVAGAYKHWHHNGADVGPVVLIVAVAVQCVPRAAVLVCRCVWLAHFNTYTSDCMVFMPMFSLWIGLAGSEGVCGDVSPGLTTPCGTVTFGIGRFGSAPAGVGGLQPAF